MEREEKRLQKALKMANMTAQKGQDAEIAQVDKSKVISHKKDENDRYGGLSKEEIDQAEMLLDPEQAIRSAGISRK